MGTPRFAICLLMAPLVIPLVGFPPWKWHSFYELPMMFLSGVFAYLGIFLFGAAAYALLRAKKWTAVWFAPAAGFVVAGLAWWLMGIFIALVRRADLLDVHWQVQWLRFALWPCGPAGALVATLLWVMARLGREEPWTIVAVTRPAIAFLVAPLAIPVFVAVEYHPWEWYRLYDPVVLYFSTIIAYVSTFLFGIPAYLFLRGRKWMALWFAPLAGFIAGGAAWLLLGILTALRSGSDPLDVHALLDWLRFALWPYGPLGALVGVLLWLIARPDRAGGRGVGPGGQHERDGRLVS